MSTTANTVITGALQLINALGQGETPSAAVATDGLRRLNLMLGSWSLQPLTKPVQSREVFPLVPNYGGPDSPYTIGPGGDFDTERPNPEDVQGVGLLLATTGSAPAVEITRTLLTDDMFEAIAIKDLSNSLFTTVYYNATYTGDLGSVTLWPVPDTNVNSIVFYLLKSLRAFSSLTAQYDLPRGLDEALEYNLALRLARPYGFPLPPEIAGLAAHSLSVFKRSNVRMSDQANDPALTQNRRGGYNINTDTGT